MCSGVYYSVHGHDTRVYFPNPQAQLPVRVRDGTVAALAWGRRQ